MCVYRASFRSHRLKIYKMPPRQQNTTPRAQQEPTIKERFSLLKDTALLCGDDDLIPKAEVEPCLRGVPRDKVAEFCRHVSEWASTLAVQNEKGHIAQARVLTLNTVMNVVGHPRDSPTGKRLRDDDDALSKEWVMAFVTAAKHTGLLVEENAEAGLTPEELVRACAEKFVSPDLQSTALLQDILDKALRGQQHASFTSTAIATQVRTEALVLQQQDPTLWDNILTGRNNVNAVYHQAPNLKQGAWERIMRVVAPAMTSELRGVLPRSTEMRVAHIWDVLVDDTATVDKAQREGNYI